MCVKPQIFQVNYVLYLQQHVVARAHVAHWICLASGARVLEELHRAHRRRRARHRAGREDRVTCRAGAHPRHRHHARHQRQTGQCRCSNTAFDGQIACLFALCKMIDWRHFLQSVMSRVEHMTQAVALKSVDGLTSRSALGSCQTFRLHTFTLPDGNNQPIRVLRRWCCWFCASVHVYHTCTGGSVYLYIHVYDICLGMCWSCVALVCCTTGLTIVSLLHGGFNYR